LNFRYIAATGSYNIKILRGGIIDEEQEMARP
jgi:hypothetical protein